MDLFKEFDALIICDVQTGKMEIIGVFETSDEALDNIDLCISTYCRTGKIKSLIFDEQDFSKSTVKANDEFPNGLCFVKGDELVTVYRKKTVLGTFTNTRSLKLSGYINTVIVILPAPKRNPLEESLLGTRILNESFESEEEFL